MGNHYIAAMVNCCGRAIRGAQRGTGLAKPVDHFRASDITFWGVFALVAWTVAVLGANLSGFIPDSILGGLHSTRMEGANLNQLRGQVAELQAATNRLKQENTVLLQRFMLNEQASGEVTRRVGALELTLPHIVEALNSGTDQAIDRGTTASTSASGITSFDVDGGSVSYRTTPMVGVDVATERPVQIMPEPLFGAMADSNAFGIALGPPIDLEEGEAAWRSMTDKVGALLIGLSPLLGNVEGSSGKRLVAGPVASEADARQLCGRMAKVGIACSSVAFIGDPLPLLN